MSFSGLMSVTVYEVLKDISVSVCWMVTFAIVIIIRWVLIMADPKC